MTYPDDETMLDIREVGIFMGGKEKPVDPSTIYAWIRKGRFPKPEKYGRRISRWRLSDCKAFKKSLGETK